MGRKSRAPGCETQDHVSAVLGNVNSQEDVLSNLESMCMHAIALHTSGTGARLGCPPRAFIQAQHSARRWILDIFHSPGKAQDIDYQHLILLWDVFQAITPECCEIKELQVPTKVILQAAATAAGSAVESSIRKGLLCCCGEYLFLLSAGNAHALMAPILKMCNICFSYGSSASVHGDNCAREAFTICGADLLQCATQISIKAGGSSHQQLDAQLQGVLHHALPLAHAPDTHMMHITPKDRAKLARQISEALRSLSLQSATLQRAVQDLQSASSEQGIAALIGNFEEQCTADKELPKEGNEATETQLSDKYLGNELFAPWQWLEHQASGQDIEQWQSAMVSCLPEHVHWLMRVCSTSLDSVSSKKAPKMRSRKSRRSTNAEQDRRLQWIMFLAVLHRSCLSAHNILSCGKKSSRKRSKSCKKRDMGNPAADTAVLLALKACAITIRACREEMVYVPAEDTSGRQKACLKQFAQFLLGLCEVHASAALQCGVAAVLSELAPLEHSIVTENVQTCLQLSWLAACLTDAASEPESCRLAQHAEGTGLVRKVIAAFSSLRDLRSLLDRMFSGVLEDFQPGAEPVLLNDHVLEALATAAHQTPAAQASKFIESVTTALERAAKSCEALEVGQLRCICSIAASVLSSIPVSQVVQVASLVQACKGLVCSMQAVIDAYYNSGRKSNTTERPLPHVACLPLLRVQAVAWHLHSSCAALDPSIHAQPTAIQLPVDRALQELSNGPNVASASANAVNADQGATRSKAKATATLGSSVWHQASVTIHHCAEDASQSQVPPLVCALVLWGCHALVDGAALPFNSSVDAHIGCAACCVQLTRHYEDAMLQSQYSVACEKAAMRQPDDSEPSDVDAAVAPHKALSYISTLAGLLFTWSSSTQALGGVSSSLESTTDAVECAKAASSVWQLLQQVMPVCVEHMSTEVKQLVIKVCIKACLTGPAMMNDSLHPRFVSALKSEHTVTTDTDGQTAMSEALVVQQSAPAASLEVLRSISCSEMLDTLLSTSNMLCQELCEAVKPFKGVAEGNSASDVVQAAVSACMECIGSAELMICADSDSAQLWGLIETLCEQFLSSYFEIVVSKRPTNPSSANLDSSRRYRLETGELAAGVLQNVANAIQRIGLYVAVTASLFLRDAANVSSAAYPQQVLQSVVACLASTISCSMLMHCMGLDNQREAGQQVTCELLSWLAEACSANRACHVDLHGAPAALSKWLQVSAHTHTSSPAPQSLSASNENRNSTHWMTVTCQLRVADILAYIAKQALQAQDSKKRMKKLLKRMHPQLRTRTGSKRKRSRSEQEDCEDETLATASVPESVLPLLSGVVRAVDSECIKSEEVQPGAQVVLQAARQACETISISQQCDHLKQRGSLHGRSETTHSAQSFVGGDKDLSRWVGQLNVVHAQLACCTNASSSSEDIVERLQASIQCAEGCLASVDCDNVSQWQTQEPQLLQLLSVVETCLKRVAVLHPASAHQAAPKVVKLCMACLQVSAHATPQQPMQSPAFQAATHVIQIAFEAISSHESPVILESVLEQLGSDAHQGQSPRDSEVPKAGSAGVLCGFTALLLLLECSSPAMRCVMEKRAVAVFQSVVAGQHANVTTSCSGEQQHFPARVNAATSLSLRCMESMCAQKRSFKLIGPVLHQVTSCVTAATAALMLQVQAANIHKPLRDRGVDAWSREAEGKQTATFSPMHKATDALCVRAASASPQGEELGGGVVQVLGGCCSLITALLRHRPEAAEAATAALPWLTQQCINCIACFYNTHDSHHSQRQELVDAAAAAVGGVWEAAAGCNAGQTYLPLLVQGYLKARCTSAPGEDAMRWGALQLVGALSDTQLQQAHRQAVRQGKTGLAAQVLAELRAEFGKRFKYTGKL